MQVLGLVDDEVQTRKSNLSAQLHLLEVVEVEDETHVKHDESMEKNLHDALGIRIIYSCNMDTCILVQVQCLY